MSSKSSITSTKSKKLRAQSWCKSNAIGNLLLLLLVIFTLVITLSYMSRFAMPSGSIPNYTSTKPICCLITYQHCVCLIVSYDTLYRHYNRMVLVGGPAPRWQTLVYALNHINISKGNSFSNTPPQDFSTNYIICFLEINKNHTKNMSFPPTFLH